MVRGTPPARRKDPAPTTPDPIEIAMEAEASGLAPPSAALRLIERQGKLVGWQIAGEQAGFGLKLLTGLAGLALAVALGVMAWQASQDQSIVVRAFHAPASYAARGLDGEVLAGRFMDRLREVQRTTARGSLISARRLADEAAGLKVDIPRTGVSIADLQQLLSAWLGHRTVVTGALSEVRPGEIVLEARMGSAASVRVRGPPEQLDALVQQLAEEAFGAIRPNQLSIYLRQVGRLDEGRDTARAYARRTRLPGERDSSGISIWGQAEGDYRVSQRLIRRAVEEAPSARVFWRNLANAEFRLGRENAALSAVGDAQGLPRNRDFDAYGHARIDANFRYLSAYLAGDFAAAAAIPFGGDFGDALALRHDDLAWRRLAESAGDGDVELFDFPRLALRHAIAERDWTAAAAALAAWDRESVAWLAAPAGPGQPPRAASQVARADLASQAAWRIGPLRALVLARTGRLAEARAVADALPADCAPCQRARAVTAEAAGDRAAADRAFAAALKLGSGSPFTEAAWGEALLARGDIKGALAKLRAAVRKGPRFAEAQALLGEALAASGDAKAAAACFDRAAELAPRWGGLQRRRTAAFPKAAR